MSFAHNFNNELGSVCDYNGLTDLEKLNKTWSDLATDYAKMYEGLNEEEVAYIKLILSNAVYAVGQTTDSLEVMLEKYDYIVSKYNLENDFLSDDALRAPASSDANINNLLKVLGNDFDSTETLIFVVALVISSFVLVGISFKKRKNDTYQ